MSEAKTLKDVQLALVGQFGARLFRNNVGMLEDKIGNKVRYGLCVGSSDLIGWKSIVIKPEHVGARVAVFMAVETKSETGKLTQQQALFINAVRQSGGLSLMARSKDDAVQQMKEMTAKW